MANKVNHFKTRYAFLFFSILVFFGCSNDADYSGFFRSTDRVNDRFEQSDDWNKFHPFKNLVVNTDNYRLLVASDVHIGGLRNFNILLDEAKKPENLAFVIVGDVVSGEKEDYLVLKDILPDFDSIPYFLLVGNHDLYFDGWKTFHEYFGTSTYYFTVQTPAAKDIFICLDTGGGTLGDKQLAWFKNLLSTQRANYRNCVVFTHVNFFLNWNSNSTGLINPEINTLLDLFVQYHIVMSINGHDHIRGLTAFGYTTYLTLDAFADYASNASFLRLNVTGGKIGYEYQEINH